MIDIKGVIPPCITIFNKKGDLDEIKTREHIDFLIKNGVDGIFLLGSAGEFSYISDEEKLNLIKWGIDEIKGRVPVLIGISSPSPKISINLAKRAELLGADALVSIYHPYFPLNLKDILIYYNTILDEIELPFLIYNFPMVTNYNLSIKEIKLLSERENVIGIKDTTVDYYHVLQIKNEVLKENFKVFVGSEVIYSRALDSGIYDAILGTMNLIPNIYTKIYQAAIRNDKDAIKANMDYINQIIRQVVTSFTIQYGPFITKTALSILGRDINTAVRIPLSEIRERKLQKLEKGLEFLKEIHEY